MSILNAAEDIIRLIRAHGVEGEVVLKEYESRKLTNRLMKPEETIQKRGRQIGIRVVDGKKHSCLSSNDLGSTPELVDAAVKMASLSPEDPFICLSEETGSHIDSGRDLMLCDDSPVDVDHVRDFLVEMEEEALAVDARIVNSEGAHFSQLSSQTVLMTTKGFCGSYRKSSFSSYVSVVASDNSGKMEVDYSFSVKSHFNDIEKAKVLGRDAASRARRRLNAREIKTCKIPIVFENRIASSLLSNFASAINGNSIADRTSFLAENLGSKLFGDNVSVIDDPVMPRGISSAPFDGEGVISKKKNIVKDGILQSWILDMRTAKQLSLLTTGNASRSDNASVFPAVSNFYISGSETPLKDLISDIKKGLYVTDLFGFGINFTTGDYSQGAFGFFIENGSITYPVNGITIAGNMRDMFLSMKPADDLAFFGSINSPSLRFNDMVVSGTD